MLILASASPRRRELMEKLHCPYQCEPAVLPEVVPEGISPGDVPLCLARHKAKEIFEKHRTDADPPIVIGSDTVVISDGIILGKPKDAEDAKRMLRMLSGKSHQVLTGVCILSPDKESAFTASTDVEFYPLSEVQISSYVNSGEPMDKAGAYGIQGDGALLVKEIRGDYYTVMGFPIARIARELENF